MKRNRGFTLIELMIVVAVIGILAAIAYPSYQSQMIKSRRSDAQTLMLDIATREERFFFDNARYTATPASIGINTVGAIMSDRGHYSLNIDITACANACYDITATALGTQLKDGNLTLDQKGEKLPEEKW